MSACHCDQYGYPHPFDRQFCGTHPTSGPPLPTEGRDA
jgi:hypothetical protein